VVDVETSSPTCSKSGHPPFAITLKAWVDGDHPVTIDAFKTLLHKRPAALDYQGLTFTDIETGKLAQRRVIDIHTRLAPSLTATSDSVVEIPSMKATEPYTVSHSFQIPTPSQPASSADPSVLDAVGVELLATMSNQAVGLNTGHTYEIGLGTQMSSVTWWREGTMAEAFAHGPIDRRAEGPRLRIVLANTARFEVVE